MKIFIRIIMCLVLLALAALWALRWHTTLDFTPSVGRDLGTAFTLQADDFLVNIPESYQMTRLVGLLEWPGRGRMHFIEEITGDDALTDEKMKKLGALSPEDLDWGAEAIDLSEDLGRPAVLTYRPPMDQNKHQVLSLAVKFKGGILHLTPFPSRRPPSGARPPIDEHRAFVAEQKEILVRRAKEFLETYYWLGDSQSQPEPGVFRTHYGLISKKGGESFRYWPIRATFWSPVWATTFDITTRRSTGDAVKVCSREKLERVLQQRKESDGGMRSNCEKLIVGDRNGYELILLDSLSFNEESSYRLFWEPAADESNGQPELRLSFKMNSPLRGRKDGDIVQTPDDVIGRWRAMLGTVRFFDPVVLEGDKTLGGPEDETTVDPADEQF